MDNTEVNEYNVTDETVTSAITHESYIQAGFKTMVCVLVTNTGVECVGSHSPVGSCTIVESKKIANEDARIKVKRTLESVHQWQLYITQLEQAKEKAAAEAEPEAEPEEPANDVGGKSFEVAPEEGSN